MKIGEYFQWTALLRHTHIHTQDKKKVSSWNGFFSLGLFFYVELRNMFFFSRDRIGNRKKCFNGALDEVDFRTQ